MADYSEFESNQAEEVSKRNELEEKVRAEAAQKQTEDIVARHQEEVDAAGEKQAQIDRRREELRQAQADNPSGITPTPNN